MAIISYEDFRKLDLRIVEVTKAEPIPGKTRVLKLTVDIGSGDVKTIIAGGAEYYKQESFVKKKFVAIVNLEPKKVAGLDSHGMLLAADAGGKPLWLTVDAEAPVGSRVI